jgi:probable F420-dependent oxidoreductase
MTFAAACTSRIRIGCTVFVTPLHSPVHLAKALSSLDQLSRGRLDVGIGTGGKARPWAAFGLTSDRYVARFAEGLELMKALWTQPRVNFDGEFWQLSDAAMEPKSFQKPHPPIWFGASAEPSLRRAVRLGDGFFGAGSSTTLAFADQVRTVRQALDEAGRDPGSFPIAKRIYIVVDDDSDRGRERVNDAMARIYGRRMPSIEAAAVGGTPADCIREANAVAAAGAEMILFTAVTDQAEQMERLAAEVMPHVRPAG